MVPTMIVLGVLIVIALAWVVIYNGLVQKRVRCQEAWSQIDVQLKRRHDLIPNLVETVKGYATHEAGTLEKVVQARNAAIAAPSGASIKDRAELENVLSGALRQLFALSESYPNLKANENFARLQEELASTENRIAFARQHFNDTAAIYNTDQQSFPKNVIASMFGFRPQEYFELDNITERETPKVQF